MSSTAGVPPPSRETQLPFAPTAWCLGAAMLFGASTPASKGLLAEVGSVTLSGVLYAGAALAVAPWALRSRGAFRGAHPKDLLRLAGAALFGGVLGPILLLEGLRRAPAGSVALWLNLETVATALLARWLFREHLGGRAWTAIVLVVGASALLSTGSRADLVAVALVGLACVAWGLDNNLTAVIDRFTPAHVTFVKGAAAASVNLTVGLSLQSTSPSPTVLSVGLLVGALSYGLSLQLYVRGAQHLGATRSQLVFSTAPLWGLIGSWLVLREPLGWDHLASAALMGGALWVWHREEHSHLHEHPPVTHRHWHRHDDGHHDHEHPDAAEPDGWHIHEHTHGRLRHAHSHRPDLHHRHSH